MRRHIGPRSLKGWSFGSPMPTRHCPSSSLRRHSDIQTKYGNMVRLFPNNTRHKSGRCVRGGENEAARVTWSEDPVRRTCASLWKGRCHGTHENIEMYIMMLTKRQYLFHRRYALVPRLVDAVGKRRLFEENHDNLRACMTGFHSWTAGKVWVSSVPKSTTPKQRERTVFFNTLQITIQPCVGFPHFNLSSNTETLPIGDISSFVLAFPRYVAGRSFNVAQPIARQRKAVVAFTPVEPFTRVPKHYTGNVSFNFCMWTIIPELREIRVMTTYAATGRLLLNSSKFPRSKLLFLVMIQIQSWSPWSCSSSVDIVMILNTGPPLLIGDTNRLVLRQG